jgi:putative flippase GtrA
MFTEGRRRKSTTGHEYAVPVTELREEPAKQTEARRRRVIRALAGDRRIRYLVVGGVSTVIYYVTFSAGWLLLSGRIPYLLMAIMANFSTAVVTYPMYRRGVFQYAGPWLSGFVRFYALGFGSMGWSFIGLPLLIEVGHVPVLLAQAMVLVLVPVLNYQVMKFWTFGRRHHR